MPANMLPSGVDRTFTRFVAQTASGHPADAVQYLLDAVLTHPDAPIPDLLNTTFHTCDSRLSHLAQSGNTHSGCTAVTAFLRIEEEDTGKGFTNDNLEVRGLLDGKGEEELEAQTANTTSSTTGGTFSNLGRRGSRRRIRDFVKGLTSSSSKTEDGDEATEDKVQAVDPKTSKKLKRVLYTANVGDARAVLWYVSSIRL
jgi:protein phosphatase PTC1